MFENWTRKLSIVVLAVWAVAVLWRLIWLRESVGLSDIATSGALLLATIGGKSVASSFAEAQKAKNGNGGA